MSSWPHLATAETPLATWAELLPWITWPGALAIIAYSPPARALAAWLQSQISGPPKTEPAVMELMLDIAQAVESVSESQARQAEVLQRVLTDLKVLLDRVPR